MANSLLEDKTVLLDKLNKQLSEIELENNNINNNNKNELNQINYKKVNTNKNENKINNGNKIDSLENQTLISPIKPTDNINNSIEINDNMIADIKDYNNSNKKIDNSKINNRYNGGTSNNLNNQTYNKKMILQQLDIQKDQENLINMDKSINLKKNKFKPNFSFTLNDTNIKDKKVNLSVALMPKRAINKEEKNESEGEIKEDIQINSNINEEKNNLENKIDNQKLNTNLSQNISMEKNENEQGKNRENDLNTFPYDDEIDNGEKKNNNNKNENNDENYNFTNSNEQEHIFEKE